MFIDRTHRGWFGLTVFLFLIATGLYVVYARSAPDGPRGGSWQGLWFGVAGSALMVYAGLLSARKKMPRARVGTALTWLKGHVWLGLLSVPLIFFHAGFRWGGLVEQLLMAVFLVVIVSGLLGLILQRYLPGVLRETTPREAMYEQIPRVCAALRETADQLVAKACDGLFAPCEDVADENTAAAPQRIMRDFHVSTVRPYLAPQATRESPLGNKSEATALFAKLRRSLTPDMHPLLDQLADICDERRELTRQATLHRWLHGWLFLHVPLSATLLVLAIVHVVASLYY